MLALSEGGSTPLPRAEEGGVLREEAVHPEPVPSEGLHDLEVIHLVPLLRIHTLTVLSGYTVRPHTHNTLRIYPKGKERQRRHTRGDEGDAQRGGLPYLGKVDLPHFCSHALTCICQRRGEAKADGDEMPGCEEEAPLCSLKVPWGQATELQLASFQDGIECA